MPRPRPIAAIIPWTEQTWQERWWGDGFRQLRRRFEAEGGISDTSMIHENRRYIGGGSNTSDSVPQNISYTVSERVGHEVSITGQARAKWLQASVGYTFTYERTTSRTASGTIAPRKQLFIFESDVRIQEQLVWVDVFQQRATNLFATRWTDTGLIWDEDELIREYNGNWVEFLEYPL